MIVQQAAIAICTTRALQWTSAVLGCPNVRSLPVAALVVLSGGAILYCSKSVLTSVRATNTNQKKRVFVHVSIRRSVVAKILSMLREKHGSNDPDRRLPRIARSLEFRLLDKATTFEGYMEHVNNDSLLKKRLRVVVKEIYDSFGKDELGMESP